MEDKNFYSVKGAAFEAIDIPKVKEIRGKKYMYYGEDNLFPELLIELYDGSAMHHTAIEAIKDGIIINRHERKVHTLPYHSISLTIYHCLALVFVQYNYYQL